jgi:uncharacterized protein YrrD
MADTDTLTPSDIIASASDELGSTLAAVRGQALAATGEKRNQLFDQFDQLLRRHRRLMFRDLKAIDQDPAIVEAVQTLSELTQRIAKVRREMKNAKDAIDGATKVLGFVDQFLRILGKVGLLA